MAYDEGLAQRINELWAEQAHAVEKKMFGGLAFMLNGHMCCGIIGEQLMARVGPTAYEDCVTQPYAKPMTFTGKAMKGMVYVDPAGFDSDDDLIRWIRRCEDFVLSLPPK